MRRVLGVAVMAALLALGAPAKIQAQESSDISFKTKALEVSVGGRVQLRAGTSSCNAFPIPDDAACEDQVPSSDLFLRRAPLTFTV